MNQTDNYSKGEMSAEFKVIALNFLVAITWTSALLCHSNVIYDPSGKVSWN